jgi:hypothetical protein
LDIRKVEIPRYMQTLANAFAECMPEASALKRMKSLVRFIFDDFEQGQIMKSQFLRSTNFSQAMSIVQ